MGWTGKKCKNCSGTGYFLYDPNHREVACRDCAGTGEEYEPHGLNYFELLAKYGTHRHGHSIYAPSSSAMWLACAGSLLVNAVADDDAGVDAAYGTVAHHVAERWHKLGKKPVKLLGRIEEAEAGGNKFPIRIDDAMMEFVGEYVAWCNEVPGDHYYEQRVDLSELLPIPNQGGTADHFVCEPGVLTITDLKMGTGIRVYAKDNPQAQLYALGVFLKWDVIYDFQRIVIRICQPRLNVFETWELTREQLLEFGEFVRQRALLAWNENASRTPGEKQCKFCAAKKTCAARVQHADDLMDAIFGEDLDAEPATEAARKVEVNLAALNSREYTPTTITQDGLKLLPGVNAAWNQRETWKRLSTHALSYILTHRKHIEALFKDIFVELLLRAENGEKLPYQKLTEGRTKRVWADANKAFKALQGGTELSRDQVMPPKMLPPAQIEKLLRAECGWKPAEIKRWLVEEAGVVSRAGGRTLADLRDERSDSFDETAEMFETDMEDDDEL